MKNEAHPNKLPFEGVLTRVDVPSDKSPNGARGHRVLLTREAAEQALDSLIGMGVGFANSWGAHNPRQKCGVITNAWLDGDELRVAGYVYARDFEEVVAYMRKPDVALGMSYEIVDAHVADMRADVFRLTRVTFTGAAILLRDKAAYTSSSINLLAAAELPGTLTLGGEGSLRSIQFQDRRIGRFERWTQRFRIAR